MNIAISFDEKVVKFQPREISDSIPVNRSGYTWKASIILVITGGSFPRKTSAGYGTTEQEAVFSAVKTSLDRLNLNGDPITLVLQKDIFQSMTEFQRNQLSQPGFIAQNLTLSIN